MFLIIFICLQTFPIQFWPRSFILMPQQSQEYALWMHVIFVTISSLIFYKALYLLISTTSFSSHKYLCLQQLECWWISKHISTGSRIKKTELSHYMINLSRPTRNIKKHTQGIKNSGYIWLQQGKKFLFSSWVQETIKKKGRKRREEIQNDCFKIQLTVF